MSVNPIRKHRALPVMLQGTSSHVGKSVLTAALCRILADRGLSVAPFKAQNMALNSFVTADGGEIGVAQALQAEAARLAPTVDMNPVLLKPSGDSVSQVIIHGRVHSSMSATEYHAFKPRAAGYVLESYERLASMHDVVVIEGAGSPAEINLRAGDIANMGVAEMVDSPVILVGDIDRGGVFASLVGTMELLTPAERDRVVGFIINKFRGDKTLLDPGLDFLFDKTGVPVLGVVPYLSVVDLPDEDSVSLDRGAGKGDRSEAGSIKITVVRLPRISNFTDFDPIKSAPGVEFSFATRPEDIDGAALVILPGSKNTISDMRWLAEQGLASTIAAHHAAGGMVAGICGGLQMLGRSIADPTGVEAAGAADGLGLLDMETTMEAEKTTSQVRATVALPWSGKKIEAEGYEIHMGRSTVREQAFAAVRRRASSSTIDDGAVSADGRVWGTYMHGIFDNDTFTASLLGHLRGLKGSVAVGEGAPRPGAPYKERRESAIATFSASIEESLDMEKILEIIGLAGTSPAGAVRTRG